MSESVIVANVRLHYGRGAVRVFRNNVGSAWMGKATRLPNGDVLIKGARHVTFGLCPGSSDLIGWRSVVVTPEMVGQKLAVFLALEGKQPGEKPTDEQAAFIAAVQRAGGLAGPFNSVDAAGKVIRGEGK